MKLILGQGRNCPPEAQVDAVLIAAREAQDWAAVAARWNKLVRAPTCTTGEIEIDREEEARFAFCVREVPPGTLYRVRRDWDGDGYPADILEFFDPSEWLTAT